MPIKYRLSPRQSVGCYNSEYISAYVVYSCCVRKYNCYCTSHADTHPHKNLNNSAYHFFQRLLDPYVKVDFMAKIATFCIKITFFSEDKMFLFHTEKMFKAAAKGSCLWRSVCTSAQIKHKKKEKNVFPFLCIQWQRSFLSTKALTHRGWLFLNSHCVHFVKVKYDSDFTECTYNQILLTYSLCQECHVIGTVCIC